MSTTPTNTDRAESAQRTLEFFSSITELEEEPDQDVIADMLTNFMHWCQQEGVDFNAALHTATFNYEAEK